MIESSSSPVQGQDPLDAMMALVGEESGDAPAYADEDSGTDEAGYGDASEEYVDGEDYEAAGDHDDGTDDYVDAAGAHADAEAEVDGLLAQVRQSQDDYRNAEKLGQRKSQEAASSNREVERLEGELVANRQLYSDLLEKVNRMEGMWMASGGDAEDFQSGAAADPFEQYQNDPVIMGLVRENQELHEWRQGVDSEMGAQRNERQSAALLDHIQTQADTWVSDLYGEKPDPGTREYNLLATALNEWVIGAGLDPTQPADPSKIQNAYEIIIAETRRIGTLDGHDLEDRADEADLVGEDYAGSSYGGEGEYYEDDEYPEVPDNLDFLSEPEQDIALVDYLLQYTQASDPNRV
jgi:hypothetical protein